MPMRKIDVTTRMITVSLCRRIQGSLIIMNKTYSSPCSSFLKNKDQVFSHIDYNVKTLLRANLLRFLIIIEPSYTK